MIKRSSCESEAVPYVLKKSPNLRVKATFRFGSTMYILQGGVRWYADGGITPDFSGPSDRKSHATRPENLHCYVGNKCKKTDDQTDTIVINNN